MLPREVAIIKVGANAKRCNMEATRNMIKDQAAK